MCEGRDTLSAIAFYDRCADTGIAVQHNLYGSRDLAVMAELLRKGLIKGERLQLLYVLERHSENKQSTPADIDPFVAWMRVNCPYAQWTACALGEGKTECLVAAPPQTGAHACWVCKLILERRRYNHLIQRRTCGGTERFNNKEPMGCCATGSMVNKCKRKNFQVGHRSLKRSDSSGLNRG